MKLTEIGYYRIERLLGEGGMGAVYAATHKMTGRSAAIKTLRPELAARADLNARFFNEARTISYLDHPGIVRIMDVGRTPDGAAYMVMEHCEGPTLGEALRSAARVEVRLSLLRLVAEAVAYAHQQGVAHRDLKPDNVIVTGSLGTTQPKVLDFGIAKVMEGSIADGAPFSVKTRTGTAMGTPLYMSPEQCRGVGGVMQATDVYSLGVMMFEAIVGKVPFAGGVGEVIVQHLTTPPPDVRWPDGETLLGARPALSALIRAMMAKQAGARPTMAEVVDALSGYAPFRTELQSESEPAIGIEPRPSYTTPPVVVSSIVVTPRRRRFVPFAIIAAGLMFIVGYVAWRTPGDKPSVRPAATVADPHVAEPARLAVKWRIESQPTGADVASADGHILGRTPYDADADLGRGERQLYVRKSGFLDELVNYDGKALSSITLRPRTKRVTSTRPGPRPTTPPHDTFVVTPLH